jgi:ubiquinone/menaquinone biosynthesis C-methylase UbiE
MTDMDPREYYDEFADGEWNRLEANPVSRLEFENTIEYLENYVPGSGHVLDAGGGAGRYTIWLAERGYDVNLVDLSAEQIRIAREKADEYGVSERITARQGDIRDLPFGSKKFDAVCCLGGPLSHIVSSEERERALSELRRVARDGAPVFVSVIGRLATLRDIIKHVPEKSHGLLVHLAETGDYTAKAVAEYASGEGWAECHFFRAAELEADLSESGFAVETVAGLEGPASNMQRELGEASEEARESVRELARALGEDRVVADFSEHILAVARA